MFRSFVIVVAVLVTGCTVEWLELRTGLRESAQWKCPGSLTVTLTSAFTTNTFGPKEERPEKVKEQEERYRVLAEQALGERQCALNGGPGSEDLKIEIKDMEQISALPQEWLTGLSFGLIPSWGTRQAELQFSLSQGSRKAVYLVDDKRVNHLILFPVFWLSFFLSDPEKQFENALDDFMAGV